MMDTRENYQRLVEDYKAQQFQEMKEIFPPYARHRLKEVAAYNSQVIKMSQLAINENRLLFRQLSIICQLIQRQNRRIIGPLGAFLNIWKIFNLEDQHNPEITYFVDRNTKELSELSLDKLIKIWNRMRQLEIHQFFIFNLTLKNFSSIDHFLINLNNLIVLKLDYEIWQQEQDNKESWVDSEIQKQLIMNSKRIVQDQTFYRFIKQKVDPTFPKNYFNLDSFYYLHRKEFIKFVRILIEKRQKLQMTVINKQLITALQQIQAFQMSPYVLNRKFFDIKLEQQLKKCLKIVNTEASSSQIHKYYKYPQLCYFKDYTEEEHSMLVHSCRQLLDKDRIDVDLLEGSFNCILDPRDFLYLETDIQALYQQELKQQQSLLNLEDSIDNQTKQALAQTLRSSADRIKTIFNSAKLQTCKFFTKTSQLSVRTTSDSSNLLYRNYLNYKEYMDSIGPKIQCQIHKFPLQYLCDCGLNTTNPQLRHCYFCLQQKHMNHKARCAEHHEILKYLLEQNDEEGLAEQSFGCETCKRQASAQIIITSICILHRLPVHYVCLQIQCEVREELCFQCLNYHQGHQQQIVKIHKNQQQEKYPQDNSLYQRNTTQILCKQKFFKYYQIYEGKVKSAELFLHQLQNRSNKSEHQFELYQNRSTLDSNNENKQDYLQNMRIRKHLQHYNIKEIKEINEYFTDQMQQLTSKMFKNISIEVDQLQKKMKSLMFDESLLHHAQEYLDEKYEVITNLRNSRMEEVMSPCRLSEADIPEHHYHRIKKVLIDELIDKEIIKNSDDRQGQRNSHSKDAYHQSIKQSWRQFYKSPRYKQYKDWFDKIKKSSSNELLYENKLIVQRKKQIQKLKRRQKKLSKIKLYEQQQDQLKQFQHDGQYLFSKLHEIQEKVEERASEIHLTSQLTTLSQFELIKRLPNIQHYELKIYDISNIYEDISAQEISCLFNSSNLNYLRFDYQFQAQNLKSIVSQIAQQNFNKKICLYLSSQNAQCIHQSYKQFIQQNSERRYVQKYTQLMYFGNIHLQFQSSKLNETVPYLRKIVKNLENLDDFGISLVFNQLQEDNTEQELTQNQQSFLINMFTFIASRSQLSSLRLKEVYFNEASNRLLSQVFQSNYQLTQLVFAKCNYLDQNCFQYINNELQIFQIIQTRFDGAFCGNCLLTFTKLKKLVLNDIFLNTRFFEPAQRKFKDTLIDLSLIDVILDSVLNSDKTTTQFFSFKQLFSLFEDCSLHYLQVQHNALNPKDLLELQSAELSYLKLSNCQKITNDCLQLINKKWPNIKILDLSSCLLLVKDPIKTWLSFKNSVQISINKNQITERELRIIRKNGINMIINLI